MNNTIGMGLMGMGDPTTNALLTTQKVTTIPTPVAATTPITPQPAASKKWYEVLNDITAGASDLVSSFKTTGYDASITPASGNDPDPKPKSNTTKYVLIGGGVIAAAVITYMIVKKKKKS